MSGSNTKPRTAERPPRNVIGNRFFLRVSEELRSLSTNFGAQSMRLSKIPMSIRFGNAGTGKKGARTSTLSMMSSAAFTADYHKSAEGLSRMQETPNPGFAYPEGKGTGRRGLKSTMRDILNEVEPGINNTDAALSGSYESPFQDDQGIKSPSGQSRRGFWIKAVLVISILAIIGLIVGVSMSETNRPQASNLGAGGLTDKTGNNTFAPSLAPTPLATLAPTPPTFAPTGATSSPTTARPTTRSPTAAPTHCFLGIFC